MRTNLVSLVGLAILVVSFTQAPRKADQPIEISSPDNGVKVTFELKDGVPFYRVSKNGTSIVKNSKLGFEFKGLPPLSANFKVLTANRLTFDDTWTQPWGEVKEIRNHYNSVVIQLQENSNLKRRLNIEFRVFNDGLGFRYEIPKQPNVGDFIISNELTEFSLAADFTTWWIPAFSEDMDSECLYRHTKLSELKEKTHTPVTLERDGKLFVTIHEAALVDYAGMALGKTNGFTLKADLFPWSNGNLVEGSSALKTPWRTIQIADRAGDLVTSYLILNLNDPNKLADVSWIKPGKYNGIWWGMHLAKNTWEGGPNHGATTENVKAYIDFASKHKLSAVLAEGWNEGWEGDWTVSGNFNFTKAYPDFDLPALVEYASKKNVGLIAHHETGGNVVNYERQLDGAFRQLEHYGIHHLKTGYVNKLPGGERHQSQFMVRHYHKVMERAAKHKVMIDVHEPVKDTGLRRTYPNMMTREGVRGTEYEAWSDGNPPSHTCILPFTRGLAGPIDYTPGIFDILFQTKAKNRVHTTLAKQLALYVVIYSPLHMAADLPENYEGNPAFKFIEDVPTDWEITKVVNGEIGEYITTIRKDRNSGDWYLGSITNETPRLFDIKLDFLPPGKKFNARIYQDGKHAHVETNPLPVDISEDEVDATSTLTLALAPGGGTAIRFSEL